MVKVPALSSEVGRFDPTSKQLGKAIGGIYAGLVINDIYKCCLLYTSDAADE